MAAEMDSPSFWKSPRKTVLRRWIFKIHFYAGLLAGLLWLVVSVTGSFVVFVPELRRMEVPGWTRVEPVGQPLPMEELLQRFQRERPTDRMYSIYFDFKPNWGLNFRSVAANGDRIHTFVDQYRGNLLASVNYSSRSHSPLQWIYELHAELLGGPVGKKINAWLAFALGAMSVSGIFLWWRGRSYWKSGLEYRAKASWKRQVWDLHNLGGFLFSLPLLLLSISGAYFAYGPAYASFARIITGGPGEIPPPQALHSSPRRSLDEIVESARSALPESVPSMIIFPATAGDPFTLRMRLESDPHRIGLNWLYVDPASAQVLRVDRLDEQPLGVQIIRLMTPLHYGTIGGLSTRMLWLIAGLMPGVLFVAGILMWWNRTLSRKWRNARQPSPARSAASSAHVPR